MFFLEFGKNSFKFEYFKNNMVSLSKKKEFFVRCNFK